MKTKDKVKLFLEMYPSLKDNDNRLCSNIWATEIGEVEGMNKESKVADFLVAYAEGS